MSLLTLSQNTQFLQGNGCRLAFAMASAKTVLFDEDLADVAMSSAV
jgi:hypothetical protein